MSDKKKRVLVICTGNSCRSQMAEGLIRNDLGDKVEVFSAGTMPSVVHPMAIRVMAEVGIDISTHRSKSLSEFWGEDFDLVVTVCDSARQVCPSFPGAVKKVHESIADPVIFGTEGDTALSEFRKSRDVIRARVVERVRRELDL